MRSMRRLRLSSERMRTPLSDLLGVAVLNDTLTLKRFHELRFALLHCKPCKNLLKTLHLTPHILLDDSYLNQLCRKYYTKFLSEANFVLLWIEARNLEIFSLRRLTSFISCFDHNTDGNKKPTRGRFLLPLTHANLWLEFFRFFTRSQYAFTKQAL